MKRLVIIGAGGQGKEVLWAAKRGQLQGAEIAVEGFCDDAPNLQAGTYCNLPLLGAIEAAASRLQGKIHYNCAIGNNAVRAKIVQRAERFGWEPLSIVDPLVLVAPGVVLGEGSYVGAGTILSPDAILGRHVLVNHDCSIGHDSQLGDFVQVCPGGRISGFAVLGEGAFVGSNGVVGPGVTVGAWASLGANSFAIRAVTAATTAVGNPARAVFARNRPKPSL